MGYVFLYDGEECLQPRYQGVLPFHRAGGKKRQEAPERGWSFYTDTLLNWLLSFLKKANTPFPNCIIMTSLKSLELFLRHSKNITEFSKNKSLKTQILRKKSCFDQIL